MQLARFETLAISQLSSMDAENRPPTFCCGPFRVSIGTATYVSAVNCFVLELFLAGHSLAFFSYLHYYAVLFVLACAFSHLLVIYGQYNRNPNLFAPCLSLDGIRLFFSAFFCSQLLYCAIWPDRGDCVAGLAFWKRSFSQSDSDSFIVFIVNFIPWSLSTALIGCHYYVIFRGFNALRKEVYKWPSRPSKPIVDE
uniref:Uncharacterized protein n=1 Tax=Globodera rostochiensis TaxID=31243 RepID=A0A914ICB2_GLORO